MGDQRTYNLRVSIFSKIWIFTFLAIFAFLSLAMLLGVLGEEPPRSVGFLLLAAAAWNWYFALSIPHRIKVSKEGNVSFISSIRSKTMAAFDIWSIKPQIMTHGFLTVRTTQGKITLLNQFDNFHDFLTVLKSLNPAVELEGC